MAFRTYAHPSLHLVVVTLYGTVTAEEISSAFRSVHDAEGWKPGFDTFWDCRRIDKLDFEPAYLSPVAEAGKEASRKFGPGRGAIVARRDLDRDIAQLLIIKMHDSERERRLFPNLETAATWLGLDPVAITAPS